MKVVSWVLKGTKSKSPSKCPSSECIPASKLVFIPMCGTLCRSLPCIPPSFWRDAAAPVNEHIQPPSRPQAMEGSPEGQVPLALSAQGRPPRRRTKQLFLTLISDASSVGVVRKVQCQVYQKVLQCQSALLYVHSFRFEVLAADPPQRHSPSWQGWV